MYNDKDAIYTRDIAADVVELFEGILVLRTMKEKTTKQNCTEVCIIIFLTT